MNYTCQTLEKSSVLTEHGSKVIDICTKWVPYHEALAISKADANLIGDSVIHIALLFLAYAIFAKAMKLI